MSSSSRATADAEALPSSLGYLVDSAADLVVTFAYFVDVFDMRRDKRKHNGVTQLYFNQRFRGLEVFGGHVTISVDSNGDLVFASGTPVSLGGAADSADLSAIDAVEAAAAGLNLADPSGLHILSGGAASAEALVSRGGISDEPYPAQHGLQPAGAGYRRACRGPTDT